MKRALIAAAAGAIGALGTAGLMSAAPASAQTCGETTTVGPGSIVCLINEQTGTFFMSVNPANQLDILINGETDENGDPSGLGLKDQPATFVKSLGEFFSGPVSP